MPRFIRNIIIAFLPFLIIGILFAYYNFIVYPNLSGDLGNIGKIEFGNQYYDDFSKPVLNNYKVIDIINSNEKSPGIFTFGDSFSQRGINGYQNFAANILDTTIVNFKNTQLDVFGNSAEQKAISMLNEGVFDSIPNSILIIESGERYFPRRILSLDFDAVTTEENVRPRDDTQQRMEKGFSDWLKYKIGFADNPVYQAKLNTKLFSHPQYSSDLFFFFEDLEKRDLEPEEIDIIERNLDKMREKFLQKNIQLVYVIVPDKYDVYKDTSVP